MKVKDLKNLFREVREEALKKGLTISDVCFKYLEDPTNYYATINTAGRHPDGFSFVGGRHPDGFSFVGLKYDQDDYDLDMIESKMSKSDDEAMVYFPAPMDIAPMGMGWYQIAKEWDISDEGEVSFYFHNRVKNGLSYKTMSISQLSELLSHHDSRRITMRVSDGKKLKDVEVDGYCYRYNELVLHADVYISKGILVTPPSTNHLLHDLKLYDGDDPVCFMYCYKTPGTYDFYDITGLHLNDETIVLEVSKRNTR